MSVLVFAESIDGHFKKATFEAISYAAEVAKNASLTCTAVSLGNTDDSKLAELAKYGADKIICIKNNQLNNFVAEAYAKVLSEIITSEKAAVVVISNTY